MASLLYNSFVDDNARNAIDLDNDTFWIMLVTATYVPILHAQKLEIHQVRCVRPAR